MAQDFMENVKKRLEKSTDNGFGAVEAIKHLLLLRRLRKILCSGNKNGFTENQERYLRENFPRIEQYMHAQAMELLRLRELKATHFRPLYIGIFEEYIKNGSFEFDNESLEKFFLQVNNVKPYPSLRESSLFTLYMRTVLCNEICALFIQRAGGAFSGQSGQDDAFLQKLFEALDTVLCFNNERSVASNPAEQVLLGDPVYRMCTLYTKQSYRKNLAELAKKKKMTQVDFAREIVKNTDNFTGVLSDKPFGGQVYIVLHIFLTVLFTFFLCILSPLFVLSVIPVFRCVKLILDRFFTRFAVRGFTEPALEIHKVPWGKGVIVTVTALLGGGKNDEELLLRLEQMYHSCGEENVYFSLLCDLPDSSRKVDENDEKTVNYVKNKILELRKKHGDVFFLFLRDRQYSKSEKAFTAPERKRGAVTALCTFLCGKSDAFNDSSIKPSESVCKNVKYVFTLDADTNLAFDCVRNTLGIMLHPNNAPVIDEKHNRVVKGYGILQPKMATSLSSTKKNFFTSVMCGMGGVDSYSSAGYDLPFALFGKGVFCGKGMFDKECFYKVLCREGAFKNETVLSHDAPEGALLRCISTNHIILTDGFPREQMSFYKRRHRWIRGDFQNLHFFFRHRINEYGEIIENGIDFISKYLMFENLADGVLQIFSLMLIFLSLATDKTSGVMLVTVALAPYILPFVHTLFSTLRKAFFYNLSRLFYSKGVYAGIWSSFFRMFFSLSDVALSGYVCFDGVIRALFRLYVSKKHMLEWTTAAQSDRESGDGILGYVKKNLFSALCGFLLVVQNQNSFLRLVGLMWMALPFTAYYWGKSKNEEKIFLKDEARNRLHENLFTMWQFFEDTINEKTNHLPVDNISFLYGKKTSFMTSPTNIGLYLASATVALKSGCLSEKELLKKAALTLDTVEKLPKYNGLLYNWYDTQTLEALKPCFVSSVDEGNYIACLYVLLGCICQFETQNEISELLCKRINKLIAEADLSFLYNRERKLFHIGFEVKDGKVLFNKNCYDMLMSETRILSYVAVSQRCVPSEHYHTLSRPLIQSNRFVGLASWSGTVFEYFMPSLFLPVFHGSVTYEALKFAFSMNVRYAKESSADVFGVSESCYNEPDDSGNYKYYAFGNEKLALCVFEMQNVISPYSSYLMFEEDCGEVLKNLSKLRDMGMYGKYGFYESCDFERKGVDETAGIVKSYMSHHVGMSICALGNFLFDGYVRNCFMNDGKNISASSLLEEKIPDEVYIKKRARKYYPNLSKTVLRPTITTKPVEKINDDNDKASDCNVNQLSLSVNADGFELYSRNEVEQICKLEKNKVINALGQFEIECFSAKRHPVSIISVKTVGNKKMCFDVVYHGAGSVKTEAGAVVFEREGLFYFVSGFCFDENGSKSQGICVAHQINKSATVYFDAKHEDSSLKTYVFMLGKSKSFDGMHLTIKNVTERFCMLREQAELFYKSLGTCYDDALDLEKKFLSFWHSDKEIANATIVTSKTDVYDCGVKALCLMYTKNILCEYTAVHLTKLLFKNADLEKRQIILLCGVFCCYCLRLESKKLREFIDTNTACYRIVIKKLTQMSGNVHNNRKLEQMHGCCLEMMHEICKRAGDDAASRVILSLLCDNMKKYKKML